MTCREGWTIETSGERGPGKSVPAARHDDDDNILTIPILYQEISYRYIVSSIPN